jgi:hypothetical protein
MRWTEPQKEGPRLPSLIGYLQFKTQIRCKSKRVIDEKKLTFFVYSYFMKDGNVSEVGTHDQLLHKRGDYYEYVQLQALSKRQ